MNKKILVSLVCGLVGVVACNGGSSGSSNTSFTSGNYQFITWDAPSNGLCTQTVPSNSSSEQATISGNGQLCLTGQQAGICLATNTSATTNCVSGSNDVTYTPTGQNTTLTISTSNCTYTNNVLNGNMQPVYSSPQIAVVPPQCFKILPGTVSSSGSSTNIETRNSTEATVSNFSLKNLIK